MAARKSSVEEDTIDVNSLRSFTIPKKKKSKRELFEPVTLNSREFQHELLPIFEKHLKDKDCRKNFAFLSARLVHNEDLLNSYLDRRKEMRRNGYTDKDVQDTFAFLYSEQEYQIKNICEHGVKIGNMSSSVLGNPDMGVSLCRHPDLSRPVPFVSHKAGHFIIFKFMKGKVKVMAENRGGVPLDPQPNYDCHISKQVNAVDNTTPQQIAFESTQYYLFEYGDFDLEERPRQIYPYAVLQFTYVGEPKAAGKQILTKSLGVSKMTNVRPPGFPSSPVMNKILAPNPFPRLPQSPSVDIRNDPRRKRILPNTSSTEEPPITRPRLLNENDPRLKPRPVQKNVSQPALISNAKPEPTLIIPKKVANVGHVGSEADSGGTIVWNGYLKLKDSNICQVDIVVFGDPIKPARLSGLNISKHIPLNGVKMQYFMDLKNLPKNTEIKHDNNYYCYAELRSAKDCEEKFSRLVRYLSKKSVAVISAVDHQCVLILLANSDLTQLLGLSMEDTPRNILHCVFISAFSRRSLLLFKNANKLTTPPPSSVPSPSQRKSVPSPGSLITAPQDESSASVSSPQSTTSWSLPPSPSVFSSPSPADSQVQPTEEDVYNNGYQKFVPVDSLVYRKNLTKAFLDQSMLQDKRNIDVARRRASKACQEQHQGFRSMENAVIDVLTKKQPLHTNSSVKAPMSPLAMSVVGMQPPGVRAPYPTSTLARMANNSATNSGLYPAKSPGFIGPLGQVIEPISPAGSASSNCASPAPSSPYTIASDSNSLVDQLQQQLHQKMSPIKDIDGQIKMSSVKADQLQEQLHQRMSPLRPPSSFGEVHSSITMEDGSISNIGDSSSSYCGQVLVPGSPQVSSTMSHFLSPQLHQVASPVAAHSLESQRPHTTNTALTKGPAVKAQQNTNTKVAQNVPVPKTVPNLEQQHALSFAIPVGLDPRKPNNSGPRTPYDPGPVRPHGPGPGTLQSLAGELKLSHPLHHANIPASGSIQGSLQSPLQQHQQCSLQQSSLYPCIQSSAHSVVQEDLLSQGFTQSLVQGNQAKTKLASDPCLLRQEASLHEMSSELCMTSDQNMLSSLSTSGTSILQNILTVAKRKPAVGDLTDSVQQPVLGSDMGIPSRDPHLSGETSLHSTLDASQNLVQSLSVGAMNPLAKRMTTAGASMSRTNSRTTSTSAKSIQLPMLMSNGNSSITNSMSNNSSTVMVSSAVRPVLSTTCSSNSNNNNNSLEAGIIEPCQTGRLTTDDDSSSVISATWQGSVSDSTRDDVGLLTDSSLDESHVDSPYHPLDHVHSSESNSTCDGSPPRLSLSDVDDLRDDFNEIVQSPLLHQKVPAADDAEMNLSDDLINLIVRSQPLAAKAARELKEQICRIEEQSKLIKSQNKLMNEPLCTEQSDTSLKGNTLRHQMDKSSCGVTLQMKSANNSQEEVTSKHSHTSVETVADDVNSQCWLSDLKQMKVCFRSPTERSMSEGWLTNTGDGKFMSGKKLKSCDLKVKVTCDGTAKSNGSSLLESPSVDAHFGKNPAQVKIKEIPIDVLSEDGIPGAAVHSSMKYAKELLYYSQLYETSSNQQLLALGLDYVSVRFLGGARVHRLQENNELCVVKDIRKGEQYSEDYKSNAKSKEEVLQESVNYVLHKMSDNEEVDEDHERVLLCQVVLHYLLPLGQAPDEQGREVLDDSGQIHSDSSTSGSQGKTLSHPEHHHSHRRHARTKEDEQEKKEIFNIYKKHRNLGDVLKCLSSRNFHSRHTRPLHTLFSGPFSKRDLHLKPQYCKRAPLTDLGIVKEKRSRSVDDVCLASDGNHASKSQELSDKADGLLTAKDTHSKQHKSLFNYTKGKLESSRNKCSGNTLLSTTSTATGAQYSKEQPTSASTPVIPTDMPTTEMSSSPR